MSTQSKPTKYSDPLMAAFMGETGIPVAAPSPEKKIPQTFRERARYMLARGISIIPLQVQSKDPCTSHAAYDATTDTAIVARWVKQFDIASNCAAVALFDGFWFLDDDIGDLAQIYKAATGLDLPKTFTVKTSRGFHYYFLHDEASRSIRYDGHDNSGVIDIPGFKGEARCNYQYVVAPFSIHPSGALYDVYDSSPIVAAPPELLEWLQTAYAQSEDLKEKSDAPKSNRKADPGFRKLFDAVGYRPFLRRINARTDAQVHVMDAFSPGKIFPCPMPQHVHKDYTDCFGIWKDVPEVLHCLGNCQFTGDMVKACYQVDGGKAKYKNMYDCARAICNEEGLNFEDFFPPKAKTEDACADSGGSSPLDDSGEEEKPEEATNPRYPIEVWEGTLFQEYADLCRSNNHIPSEFFIEGLKTIIGAICGHRITPANNHGQESRFFTTFLSEHTGDGKSEAAKWTMDMMFATGLLYTSEKPPLDDLKQIGACCDSFASGRGMVEAFFDHPRILQWYDELSVMVEKFGITGSGAAFMGLQTDMFESNRPPKSRIGGTKPRPMNASPTCHNSVLACTVKKKRDVMYAKSGAENSGWFPRESLIATGDIQRVALLDVPNLSDFGEKLKAKIMPLEHRCVRVVYPAAARKVLDDWFSELLQRTKEESDDVWGRLNVLAQRNISILTWLLMNDAEALFDIGDSEDISTEDVRVEATEDIIRRAILLAEYTLEVRRANPILDGNNDWAKCENILKKHLMKRFRTSYRTLYREAHMCEYGAKMMWQSLLNLIAGKLVFIWNKPDVEINGHMVPVSDEAAVKLPTSIFQWVGDGRRNDQGWKETRGGDRRSPYVKPGKAKA